MTIGYISKATIIRAIVFQVGHVLSVQTSSMVFPDVRRVHVTIKVPTVLYVIKQLVNVLVVEIVALEFV